MIRLIAPAFVLFLAALPALARQEMDPPAPRPAPAAPPGPYAEFIRAGAIRYWPDEEAARARPVSLGLQADFMVMGPPPEGVRVDPVFAREGEKHVVRIDVEPGTTLYGAGLITGGQPVNGRRFRVDPGAPSEGHDAGSRPLPWIVAVRPDGSGFGVLADTTAPTEIDLTAGIVFRAEGPQFPILLVLSDAPLPIVGSAAVLTGWFELPPRWALGYHHAEATYADESSLLAAAEAFRSRSIPADALWIAAEGFAPAARTFPDLARVTTELESRGIHAVWTVRPGHLAPRPDDPGPETWITASDGSPLHVPSSVGEVVLPDFSRESTRTWWAASLAELLAAGVAGIAHLDDAPFIPRDARFDADQSLGGPGSAARYGSIYPTLMARATRDAFRQSAPDRRAFISTESVSLGSQRHAVLWIPASGTTHDDLRRSLRAALSASASARFMVGLDIPGLPPGADGAPLARWFSVASLMPLVRARAGAGTTAEPWAFGPQVESTVRRALERRAVLAPYLYTLVFEAFRFDLPILRPLWTLAPDDPELRAEEHRFLLGPNILVDARSPERRSEPAAVPESWRRLRLVEDDPTLPDLYLRAGSIIPLGPAAHHMNEKPLDPLTLVVHLDAEGIARGVVFEDDGEGFAYTRNAARIGYYGAERVGDEVHLKMTRLDGGMPMATRPLVVRVLLEDGTEARAEFRDGLTTRVKLPGAP